MHQADGGAVVHRQPPAEEPGFRLDRTEPNDRHIAYTMHSYAAEKPHGERYEDNGKG